MRRVVVIGNGMVGARFADDLAARDPARDFFVTVLGAEEYEPYNRVLLSEVVAGRSEVAGITLPRHRLPGIEVQRGVEAVSIDREAQLVIAADGQRHAYDVLVLATGARARVPDVEGLDGALPPGAHVLRSLDDAREIVAAAVNARRAVVVGGGVLGLEVASGLAGRGLDVTIVHGGPHLMDRQLDAGAGAVVAAGLAKVGIGVRVATRTSTVVLADQRVRAAVLSGGEELPADLLVLTAGTVPETGLAARAGLAVDRGVVVGADLATTLDPRVFAIGDCAQPPEGGTGLIAQGWDQARRLAIELTEGSAGGERPAFVEPGEAATTRGLPLPTGGADVVRVKSAVLDVVAMGVCGSRSHHDAAHRVVRLSDPQGGRHVEVVVADGRVVGATCVGAGAVAADLTAAYSRATPVPSDPAQLLLRPVAGSTAPAASPTLMPNRATVCRCNGVTKAEVVGCWRAGADTVGEVAAATRATTGCGGCAGVVEGLLEWLARSDPDRRSTSHAPADAGEVEFSQAKHEPHRVETSAP